MGTHKLKLPRPARGLRLDQLSWAWAWTWTRCLPSSHQLLLPCRRPLAASSVSGRYPSELREEQLTPLTHRQSAWLIKERARCVAWQLFSCVFLGACGRQRLGHLSRSCLLLVPSYYFGPPRSTACCGFILCGAACPSCVSLLDSLVKFADWKIEK